MIAHPCYHETSTAKFANTICLNVGPKVCERWASFERAGEGAGGAGVADREVVCKGRVEGVFKVSKCPEAG